MDRFDQLFAFIDKDKSGELNMEEFKLFIDKMYENDMGVSNEAIENAFKFIDKGKNGTINKEELKNKLPMYFPEIFDN